MVTPVEARAAHMMPGVEVDFCFFGTRAERSKHSVVVVVVVVVAAVLVVISGRGGGGGGGGGSGPDSYLG